MSATLRATREVGFGFELRRGRFEISVDGKSVVADGEVVSFRCHGARIWPTYVASIVVPNLAIALKRE